MKRMLSKLLGIDPQCTLEGWSLHLRSGWPVAILVVLIILAAAGAVWMYRREAALGRRGRIALGIARTVALALLLLTLFRPVAEARLSTPVRPAVLVLVDDSASMAIRDTRKDVPSLAEAAMVLGKVPPDSMELPRAAHRALRAMDKVAQDLEAGNIDAARDAQDGLAKELASLKSAAQAHTPKLGEQTLSALASIEQRQAGLRKELESGKTDTALSSLRDLAADLSQWKEQACNTGVAITDRLKAELALVSRQELVQASLTNTLKPILAKISRQADVRYFRFAGDLEEVGSVASREAAGAATLDRGATCLGSALNGAVDRSAGQRVSLVVILSDGATNGGDDALTVASRLRQRGIRLVSVGVGLPNPDDASLRNLLVPEVVFANDLVPLRVQCLASGYEKRSTLLVVRIDGTEMARKTITFSGQTQFDELPFKAPRTGGTHAVEVSLVPLPGEATVENNVIRQSLRVLDEKIKVLYIEGVPRWEYRYIRAVLKRDPRIDVQFITTDGDKDLARSSKEHLGRFPEKESAAFAYDLVILGDVRANTFTQTQLSLMEQLVRDRGGSLIMLAGRKHAPAEYVDTPLAAMLPVRFDKEPWQEVSDDVHPVLTAEGRRSTVMSLERSESRTQALWSNVKPLNWVPPLLGAKPGATVLAELSDTAQRSKAFPLVAWQRYGAGKCMFVGNDQLWRLRARTGDLYHLKFWGQAVQFLALSRLLGDNQLVRLETSREQYASGEPVEIMANILNDLYEPLAAPTFTAYVSPAGGGDAAPVTLKAVPGSTGLFHGLYSPRSAGRYRLSASADAQAAPGDASARPAGLVRGKPNYIEFEVKQETTEQTETRMQRELLAKMAAITGGEYLSLRDLPLLEDTIRLEQATARFTREIDLWDNWLTAAVFIVLVAFEWAWRRNSNLA